MISIQTPPIHKASRPRLLVVNDNTNARGVVSAAPAGNYEIHQANDGLEALTYLHATSDTVCVVTDDDTSGSSGIAIAEFVRSTPSLSHVPVIVVTAGSPDPTSVPAEASVFTNKPFFSPHLLHLVNTLNRGLQREAACA